MKIAYLLHPKVIAFMREGISINSPLGQTLVHKSYGEEFVFTAPIGKAREYKVERPD